MNAVDTNVLLYIHDFREPAKQQIAARLTKSLDEPVLLWQVACEYLAASRKLQPFGYSRESAWRDIRDLRLLEDNYAELERARHRRPIHVGIQPLTLGRYFDWRLRRGRYR